MSNVFDILDMNEITEFEPKAKSGVPEKYPFSKLEIGQGFKIPEDKKISSMRVLASARGKTLGRKFSVSVIGYVERVAVLFMLSHIMNTDGIGGQVVLGSIIAGIRKLNRSRAVFIE